MIAAVFDLDRTLLPDTTAERLLLRHLVRERLIGPREVWATVRFSFHVGLSAAIQRVRADRPYLTGLHEARLRLEGERCVRAMIWPRLSECGLDHLRRHQRSGHHTVLLSGSLPYVVEPLAEAFGFDYVICSQPEVHQHRLTGRLAGLHPYGEAKATLIEDYAARQGLDLSISYCYADHHSDVPMLRRFGIPVCVNPSDSLRQVAFKCNWRVEAFT